LRSEQNISARRAARIREADAALAVAMLLPAVLHFAFSQHAFGKLQPSNFHSSFHRFAWPKPIVA
jgi:uncharacterized membrane protein